MPDHHQPHSPRPLSGHSDRPELLIVLYQDERLVAIDKPAGVLTHRSRIADDRGASAMERIRDQLGTWVYPIHRLDRATSGVLLFALDSETARAAQRDPAAEAVELVVETEHLRAAEQRDRREEPGVLGTAREPLVAEDGTIAEPHDLLVAHADHGDVHPRACWHQSVGTCGRHP